MQGRQKVVDKTVTPLQIVSLTPTEATRGRAPSTLGYLPIGNYKGAPAFLDLDKLVNQPLVQAERLYALDRLDARDIITATIPNASPLNTSIRARLGPVPSDEVWFLNRLVLVSPVALVTEVIQVNCRVSIWAVPDVRGGATVDPDGRSYWPADQGTVALDTYIVDLPAQGELGEELRLPPGGVVTLVATLTAGAPSTGALDATLTPFGRKGKLLVA